MATTLPIILIIHHMLKEEYTVSTQQSFYQADH
jgi:hypothetical protein